MRSTSGVFIFILILLVLDLYVFQAIKLVTHNSLFRTKYIINSIYWGLTILSILGFLMFVYTPQDFLGKIVRTYLFAIIIGLLLAKFLASLFLMIDDVRRMIQWLLQKISVSRGIQNNPEEFISRSVFLSWLGLTAGTVLFGSLFYGFRNKYQYKVIRQKLSFKNLPASFRGLKIVHISDIHSGSFTDKKAVEHGVEMIMAQQADLILFTGDLVNDKASEMNDFKDVFSRLKAPMGVYSTLGNHDYGDYVQWPNEGITKEQNLENLKKVQAEMGWRLLMNEHVVFEKDDEKIALIGIENWSAKGRFPKHGKMDKAYQGADQYPFKILMSHDPSHWHAQVRTQYPDIDLTLSGHTHGMQFGVEIPGFKWSPVQYMYKEWAGLYEEDNKKLYVNRGFGFIGYPGRVGVMPEITVIELK